MTIGMLVADMFEDPELIYPYYRLQEAGFDVRLIGREAGHAYTGKHGYPVTSDVASADVDAAGLEALVIPGGYAPDHMRRDERMVALVRAMHAAGKPVAAVCHAAWMLASAEVVAGRRVTSFPSIRDDLRHAGAEWVDEPVVVDGNLVTSRAPGDLPDFTRGLLGVLAGGREPAGAR